MGACPPPPHTHPTHTPRAGVASRRVELPRREPVASRHDLSPTDACPRFFEDEIRPGGRKHDEAGLVSMANMGVPNTNGSQFFFSMRGDDMQHLDGKHTVFAKVRGLPFRAPPPPLTTAPIRYGPSLLSVPQTRPPRPWQTPWFGTARSNIACLDRTSHHKLDQGPKPGEAGREGNPPRGFHALQALWCVTLRP